jgi:hypothetical protein
MDLSEIISGISALTACIATLISYRIYRNSEVARKGEGVLRLRVRALELRSRLSAIVSKRREVVNCLPDYEQDSTLAEKADLLTKQLEAHATAIKLRSSDLSESELDETELMLREFEGDLVPLERSLGRLLEKI